MYNITSPMGILIKSWFSQFLFYVFVICIFGFCSKRSKKNKNLIMSRTNRPDNISLQKQYKMQKCESAARPHSTLKQLGRLKTNHKFIENLSHYFSYSLNFHKLLH